jgi:DNA-binding NarL/FixJ family response regulator
MPESKKNIVLVDDHIIIRNGLKELIEKLGPYTVSHQFDGGTAFLEAWPLQPTPDLVFMDLSMPGMTGDQVIEKMGQQQIETPVLVLTLNEDEDMIVKLFRMGVRGYLKKDCTAAVMAAALDEIFQKGYYHNEFLTYSLQTQDKKPKQPAYEFILAKISPREKEFLKLACHEKEYTYKQIADLMSVSERTVDGYRQSVFEKFNIKSKTGLLMFVIRYKLYDHL